MLLTPCAINAQGVLNSNPHWVMTKCPQTAEALSVHNSYIFAGGEKGVYRSSNDGNNWQVVNKDLHGDTDPPHVTVLYSFGKYIFSSVPDLSGGLFRSTDEGDSWTKANYAPSVGLTSHDQYLFSIPSGGLGILRSNDSGITWVSVDSSFIWGHDYHKISFTKPAVTGKWIYAINYYGEVYQSSNNGDSLSLIYSSTGGSNHHLYTINDTTLFATVLDTIFRSTDDGHNWKVIKTGNGSGKILVNGDEIFAVQGYKIILSVDNGDSWKTINDDLPDSSAIDDLAINDNFIFAGVSNSILLTNNGVWRRSLSDFNNAVEFGKPLSDIKLSPNPTKWKHYNT